MADKGSLSRIEILTSMLLLLCLLLAGCGLGNGIGQATETPVSAALPTDTTPAIPDLAIKEVVLVNIEPPGGICYVAGRADPFAGHHFQSGQC